MANKKPANRVFDGPMNSGLSCSPAGLAYASGCNQVPSPE